VDIYFFTKKYQDIFQSSIFQSTYQI